MFPAMHGSRWDALPQVSSPHRAQAHAGCLWMQSGVHIFECGGSEHTQRQARGNEVSACRAFILPHLEVLQYCSMFILMCHPCRRWSGVLAPWSGGTAWPLWPAPSPTSRNLASTTWTRLQSRSCPPLWPHWPSAAPHTSPSPWLDRWVTRSWRFLSHLKVDSDIRSLQCMMRHIGHHKSNRAHFFCLFPLCMCIHSLVSHRLFLCHHLFLLCSLQHWLGKVCL